MVLSEIRFKVYLTNLVVSSAKNHNQFLKGEQNHAMLIAGAAVPYSPVSVTETGEEERLVYVG